MRSHCNGSTLGVAVERRTHKMEECQMTEHALKVTVQGGLPEHVLQKISNAVQKAVRDEVANIDLLTGYKEEALSGRTAEALTGPGHIMGIIYDPD
jgi:hypothetical protein